MANLTNREFYQLHGILTEERIQNLLDIEELAANALSCMDGFEMQASDQHALQAALDRTPLQ